MFSRSAAIALPDVETLKFGTKEAKPEKDASIDARVARMEQRFEERGLRAPRRIE